MSVVGDVIFIRSESYDFLKVNRKYHLLFLKKLSFAILFTFYAL